MYLMSAVPNSVNMAEVKKKTLERKSSVLACGTSGHEVKRGSYYCDTCDITICDECVTGKHRGHTFSGLEEMGRQLGNTIANTLKEIDDALLPHLQSEQTKLKDAKSERIKEMESVKAIISGAHAKELLKLEREKNTLFNNIDERQKQDIESLEDADSHVSSALKKVNKFKKQCQDAIESKNCLKLQKLKTNIHSIYEFRKLKVNIPSFESVEYLEGPEHETVLGSLTTDVIHCSDFVQEVEKLPVQYSVSVLSKFQTKYPKVESICSISQNKAWIGFSNNKRITEICESDGNLIKEGSRKISGAPVNIRAIADGLLYTCINEPFIFMLDRNGQQSTLFCTNHFPLGLYVNGSEEILVCLMDDYSFNPSPVSVRKVIKYTNTGVELMELEYDERGNRYFCLPHSVTENINSDICVVDVVARHDGRLLVFNQSGELRYSYTGQAKCDFSTCTHDQEGNIIISDENNDKIHIVSKDGQFLGFIITPEDNLYRPYAIEIDGPGCMWISCKVSTNAEAAQVVHIRYAIRGIR